MIFTGGTLLGTNNLIQDGSIPAGLTATITGGRVGWSSHGGGGANQIYLIGSEGSLLIDAYRPRLEVYDAGLPWTAPEVNPQDPMGFWSSTFDEVGGAPKDAWVTPGAADSRAFAFARVVATRCEG